MVVSVIDVGTNTVLLLVARMSAQGTISPLLYEQRIPRLGRGVDGSRNLHPESMENVIRVLEEYAQLMAPYRPERVVVCGTSALRDAANSEVFTTRVKKATGFSLEVLTGEEEALWTYRGAISGLAGVTRATVVDIGGGSTEIITGNAERVDRSISVNIGSVRLTERFFRHDPPSDEELEAAIETTENEIARAGDFSFGGSLLVGVAGTATALALLAQGQKEFRVEAVTNYRLSRDAVENLFRMLRTMPSPVIRSLSAVMEGRSDVITAGALILREIMAHFGFEAMTVSERGVRYGLVIREWEKSRRGSFSHPLDH